MEFYIKHSVLESVILLLSFSICSSLPPGARSVYGEEREKTSKEAVSLSSHYRSTHTGSIHSLVTNLVTTTGQLHGDDKRSSTSSTTDLHKFTIPNVSHEEGSEALKNKFDNLLYFKAQRHKAKESEELLKVRQVEEEPVDHQVSKMIITIASAVTALFSMCMLSAVFLCCCRKKRRIGRTEDETDHKNLIDKKISLPIKTKVKENTEEEKNKKDQIEDNLIEKSDVKEGLNEAERLADEKSDDEDDSVQKKIKAFQWKTDTPSPRPARGRDAVRPTKRRPESEAFKSFESKGILIGMGKAPTRKIEPEPENKLEENERHDKSMTPIAITGKSNVRIPDKVKEKSKGSHSVRPAIHVTAANNSDFGDFSVVRRETEVLKSHKRVAPPSGRNRMSKVAMLKARHTTVGVIEEDTLDASDYDQSDQIQDQTNKKQDVIEQSASVTQISVCEIKPDSDMTHNVTMPKPANARSILTQDKSSEDVKEIATLIESRSGREDGNTDRTSNQPALDTRDNIFFCIDPTAKSKSMGDIAKIGINSATDKDEPKKTYRRRKSSPNTNRNAPVSAFKRKLHSRVNDAESTMAANTEDDSDDDHDLDSVKRERTFSEPTSPHS